MAYNDAQKRATMKYIATNLDEVRFRVPKGKRDEIRAAALQRGYSGIQPYLIDLLEKDGVEVRERAQTAGE